MREKALVALLVGCVALACGPSLTTIHEGTVRFEHCYRVDLEPHAQSAQRKACWQRWVSSYTVGQPRDRIEYAERRLGALAGDDNKCPTLAVDGERRPEERQFYLVVPGPTSVHKSPPPIATVVSASDAGPHLAAADAGGEHAKSSDEKPGRVGEKPAGGDKAPPAAGCAMRCQSDWQRCDASCGAGPKKPACADCKSSYGACMRACFE